MVTKTMDLIGAVRKHLEQASLDLLREMVANFADWGITWRKSPFGGELLGSTLDPEIKLEPVGAVVDAKREGFAISRTCELLILSRRRFHRWVEGKDLDNLTARGPG